MKSVIIGFGDIDDTEFVGEECSLDNDEVECLRKGVVRECLT